MAKMEVPQKSKEKTTSVRVCVCYLKKKKTGILSGQYPRQMKSVFTSDLFVKSAQRIYGPQLQWEVTLRVQDLRN